MNDATLGDLQGPAGNTYDKYETRNPVARRLVAGFLKELDAQVRWSSAASVLDVGCGEGIGTTRMADVLPQARVVGLDVADPGLLQEWKTRAHDRIEFVAASAYDLPFADDSFDLVSAIEVFEHLERPERALAEIARVSRRGLLLSVPWEPVWRGVTWPPGATCGSTATRPGTSTTGRGGGSSRSPAPPARSSPCGGRSRGRWSPSTSARDRAPPASRRLAARQGARARCSGWLILGLLLKRLHDLWQEHPVPLDEASRPLLVLALLASFVAMTAYAMTWAPALRAAGAEPVPDMVAAYYAGGLGKYLPGGAWQYVGRAGILVRRGVPVGAASGQPRAGGARLGRGGGAAGSARRRAAGPRRGGRVAIVLVLALARLGALGRLVRRVPGFGGVELHRLPGLVARYVGVWLIFGVAFWLTARALFDVPASDVLRYAGVFAAAWVAGFVVVIAPGGIGVREAVIVALLQGRSARPRRSCWRPPRGSRSPSSTSAPGCPPLFALRRLARDAGGRGASLGYPA